MSHAVEALRTEIGHTRQELGETLQELLHRADLPARGRARLGRTGTRIREKARRLRAHAPRPVRPVTGAASAMAGAVRRHPAVAGAAAVCAGTATAVVLVRRRPRARMRC